MTSHSPCGLQATGKGNTDQLSCEWRRHGRSERPRWLECVAQNIGEQHCKESRVPGSTEHPLKSSVKVCTCVRKTVRRLEQESLERSGQNNLWSSHRNRNKLCPHKPPGNGSLIHTVLPGIPRRASPLVMRPNYLYTKGSSGSP